MLIRQILAGKGSDVVTTRPDATIAEVARLLKAKRIGAVVVTDADEELCGIISERDLACGLADHGADLLRMRVGDVMTREISTCSPDDGIDRLMRQMTEGRFRHLPVVQDGKMIGIISIGDVVKHRLQELENEAHMLQDYISGGA
ncbi:MAG TPA: CBS domain-containing protein [Geminicoccaceae bacterium]